MSITIPRPANLHANLQEWVGALPGSPSRNTEVRTTSDVLLNTEVPPNATLTATANSDGSTTITVADAWISLSREGYKQGAQAAFAATKSLCEWFYVPPAIIDTTHSAPSATTTQRNLVAALLNQSNVVPKLMHASADALSTVLGYATWALESSATIIGGLIGAGWVPLRHVLTTERAVFTGIASVLGAKLYSPQFNAFLAGACVRLEQAAVSTRATLQTAPAATQAAASWAGTRAYDSSVWLFAQQLPRTAIAAKAFTLTNLPAIGLGAVIIGTVVGLTWLLTRPQNAGPALNVTTIPGVPVADPQSSSAVDPNLSNETVLPSAP